MEWKVVSHQFLQVKNFSWKYSDLAESVVSLKIRELGSKAPVLTWAKSPGLNKDTGEVSHLSFDGALLFLASDISAIVAFLFQLMSTLQRSIRNNAGDDCLIHTCMLIFSDCFYMELSLMIFYVVLLYRYIRVATQIYLTVAITVALH
jgi:hypothetical protein